MSLRFGECSGDTETSRVRVLEGPCGRSSMAPASRQATNWSLSSVTELLPRHRFLLSAAEVSTICLVQTVTHASRRCSPRRSCASYARRVEEKPAKGHSGTIKPRCWSLDRPLRDQCAFCDLQRALRESQVPISLLMDPITRGKKAEIMPRKPNRFFASCPISVSIADRTSIHSLTACGLFGQGPLAILIACAPRRYSSSPMGA